MDAAQRTPKGQSYDPPPKKGGVEYKTPPNVPLMEEEQVLSILNDKGQEIPDPVPLEPPLGLQARPSLADFVHRMIHNQISQAAAEAEYETFEESDDFDVEDDPIDPMTPYEEVFMPKPEPPPPAPAATPPAQPSAVEGGGAGEGPGSPTLPGPAPANPSNETASKT